jgi:tRNA dimethylallyltransferase
MAIGRANPPLALIAGPTASGKSALALALAKRTNGVIVNADSAQVYRDLPILSAAPSLADMAQAKHRLYGFLDGSQPCSAADWAIRARQEIQDIHVSGRLPILVGGTGLYMRTLLEGIAPVPAIDETIRREVREAPVDENRARLLSLDAPLAERLKPADKARIARALEVVLSTGRSLSAWQERREGGIGAQVALRPIILLPPRDWLYARCDTRFASMIDQGAVEEVKGQLARDLDPDLPIMRSIGVRELGAHLAGDASLQEAVAAGQQATRRYAKRQYTWFANQPPSGWLRFREPLSEATLGLALELLTSKA